MSFSVVIDFLIHRLVLFLQDNSGAHGESRCQVFVIWAGFFDWADLKGLFFIFEVSRVYGRRFVYVEGTADRRKQKAFELPRVVFHPWLEEVIEMHTVNLHILGLNHKNTGSILHLDGFNLFEIGRG